MSKDLGIHGPVILNLDLFALGVRLGCETKDFCATAACAEDTECAEEHPLYADIPVLSKDAWGKCGPQDDPLLYIRLSDILVALGRSDAE